MSIGAPKVNSIKKKGPHMKGYPPETPDFAQCRHKTGNPSVKESTGSIRKPK